MGKPISRYRWIVFASVLFTYLIMSSQRTASGLITEQVMLDFHVTATTIGLLASIQFLVYTSLQIPMGLLADRYGPHYLLVIGASLTGTGTILYSLGSHEFVLLIARALTGTGDATIWVNMVLLMSQWFTAKEFTRLIGVAAMTGSLGFLLATVPFSLWIDFLGWRAAFFSAGVLLCSCGILLYFVLLKSSKQKAFIKNEIQREKTAVVLRRIFTSRQAWALFFCHFGIVGTYVGFISSWGVPFGINVYGMTRSGASQLMMIGLIGALIGAPLAGWISSRLETIKRPYVVVHIITVSSWSVFLLWNGSPPAFSLPALFFIIGLAYGANALTFAAVRQSFPIMESGLVSGFANTGGFLSAIFLPSFFGKILDHVQTVSDRISDGYYYGFTIPVLFSIIGLIGVLFVQDKRH